MSTGWVEEFTTTSGSTRYRARFTNRRGKQQTENTYSQKREAKRAAQAAAVKARSGANTDFTIGRQKFSTYVLDTWLPNHVMEISTRQGYVGMINRHLLPWFGDMRMIDINAQTVREWITYLQTLEPKLAPKYLLNLRACLSAICSTAVNDGVIPAHPVHGVKTPTVPKGVVKVITPEQFDVLYDELPYGDMQLLVETDIETGLRWSELIDLRPRDFSHGYTRIVVSHAAVEVSTKFTADGSRFDLKEYPKDGEHRVVQISRQLAAKISHHVEVNQIGDDDLLFEYVAPPPKEKQVKVVPDPETLGWTEPNEHGRIYRHGTKTAYSAAKCRCGFCRDAMSIYRAERRANGKDRPPKAPTRQQLEKHITKDWFRDNELRILWRVMIPLSMPAIATVTLMSFVSTWGEYLDPLIYLRSTEKLTIPLGVALFRGEHDDQYHLMMAISVMALTPIIIVFLAAQKYFIRGITLTGIAGR